MSREKREGDRTQTLQVRHLQGSGTIRRPVRSREILSHNFLGQARPGQAEARPGEARKENTPGLGGPERAEDFASRARNEEVNGRHPSRCRTCSVGVRSPSRFSRDTQNPQPFCCSPDVQRLGLCSTETLMFHNALMFHPYVPGALMFHRLMFQAGAYVPPTGLMFHRTTGRIVPDACGRSTWRDRARFVFRFSGDTQNPQSF